MDYVRDIISLLVKPGYICVDVGANVGETAGWMLDAGAANVICIEPMPKWAESLRKNLAGRSFEIHEVALADGSPDYQKLWFAKEDSTNPGNGGLCPTGEFPVRLTTLDELLAGSSVDFVKIDVEGMELPVLRGAKQTLAINRPAVLYETRCEFEGNIPGLLFQPIADLLHNLGYSLFDFQGGRLIPTDGLARGWNTVAIV